MAFPQHNPLKKTQCSGLGWYLCSKKLFNAHFEHCTKIQYLHEDDTVEWLCSSSTCGLEGQELRVRIMARVKIKAQLVRKATGNRLIKSTSTMNTQSPISTFY